MTDDVPDIQSEQGEQGERGRLRVIGKRADDGSRCMLLVVHEADDWWTFRGVGALGVRLGKADMVALAESILGRAR